MKVFEFILCKSVTLSGYRVAKAFLGSILIFGMERNGASEAKANVLILSNP